MLDPNTRRNYAALVAAAFADGHLSEEERLVLHRKATEMNVPIRDMNEMIERGRSGQISIGLPTSTREREELLESLIDIVCADGRVEAPEHHLLAKFASHLKLTLPDLRLKIRDRMEKRETQVAKIEPRIGETRTTPAPAANRFEGSKPGSLETIAGIPEAPTPRAPAPGPLVAHGPVQLDGPKLVDPKIADIPPVALQLIKQTLTYENDEDARRQVERMLGVTKEEAERVVRAVLAAFPDLKRAPEPKRSAPPPPPLQRPRR
jgi:uncharacterized tellurite resistance protein B-like protein